MNRKYRKYMKVDPSKLPEGINLDRIMLTERELPIQKPNMMIITNIDGTIAGEVKIDDNYVYPPDAFCIDIRLNEILKDKPSEFYLYWN